MRNAGPPHVAGRASWTPPEYHGGYSNRDDAGRRTLVRNCKSNANTRETCPTFDARRRSVPSPPNGATVNADRSARERN